MTWVIGMIAVLAALLLMPATAFANRPATEPEVAALTVAAEKFGSEGSPPEPYKPVLKESLVSTVDETWATALLEPGPPGWFGTNHPAVFHWSQLEGWHVENGDFFGCTDSSELSAETRADLDVPECAPKGGPPRPPTGKECQLPPKTPYASVHAFRASCSTAERVLAGAKCSNSPRCNRTRFGPWLCRRNLRPGARDITVCFRESRRIVAKTP